MDHIAAHNQSSKVAMPPTKLGNTTPNTLHQRMSEIVPNRLSDIRIIRTKYGKGNLGNVTVDMAYGGMRGIVGLIWEVSLLDPEKGITLRTHSLPELLPRLPRGRRGSEPMPEGMLWLLLTGEVPTKEEALGLSAELAKRGVVEPWIEDVLDQCPKTLHPMTQLSYAVNACQHSSKFAKAYASGVPKDTYWQYYFEDCLDLIAKLPLIAARIYRNVTRAEGAPPVGRGLSVDVSLDWSGNFARMMGFESDEFDDMLRLFLTIHCDHEGGNVSAHTCHVVSSALADPYLSFAACMNGLAGPLHGLANQECLLFIVKMREELGDNASNDQVEAYVRAIIKSGQVIPGYGHAVLRKTDPRYTCQKEWAEMHLPDDPLLKLVGQLFEVVPRVLAEGGKVKNPWPNVDAASGVLLNHYGLKETNYYTVLFGVSRALGVLSGTLWARICGLPIERPKSLTSEEVVRLFGPEVSPKM
ncbi:citrate synthase-like protein [Gonapodya prolifera JEL478]|uniref:Citrate synthase n=1 Tax=Gonapodya prolifera (strain JEL478) TaxID=1344416 RepID=A0A139AVH7_GONPJ|nr:citrate synthase-like protein [Gonapodya prolifera JEL478]|eukprot:KXS20704.1 citrate synthase-like protein [Gonapodya prolifera JEL478]